MREETAVEPPGEAPRLMHMATTGTWTALTIGVVVLTSCGTASRHQSSPPPEPIQVHDASDARPAVVGGRVTAELVFDGGSLRVDPPPAGSPDLDEAKAIAYLRAASLPGSYVVVAYGRASLTLPVDGTDMVVRPTRLPLFRARPAWLLLHEDGGHSCPAQGPSPGSPSPGVPAREPLPVELIAADGSGEAVAYSTAGSFCGRPRAAHAVPASYMVSLPWTQGGAGTSGSTTITATPPDCGTVSGYVGPGQPDRTVAVGATVLLAKPPCQGGGQQASNDIPDGPRPLGHAPTGLVTAMYTDGQGTQFRYYDGTDRTAP